VKLQQQKKSAILLEAVLCGLDRILHMRQWNTLMKQFMNVQHRIVGKKTI